MQQSAQRISATNLSGRLPVPPGADEIANLARLLNELFARLEASFEQIKRFTADASHELKTPLSLIRLHAEKLARSTSLDEEARAQVNGQIEEITRLNRLVDNLLLLARADAGGLQLDLKRHDTAAYLSEFAEDATALAEDRGLRFALDQNERAFAAFDAVMIRQVLLNLLSNALRYSPSGGSIVLRSRVSKGAWEFILEDEGPGIPPAALESVFERFVRHGVAQPASPTGSGLGLAIVRSIVEAHRGHVTARNRPGRGLQVSVALPGAQAGVELAGTTEAARR
jgi:signal transduction histidine kinase